MEKIDPNSKKLQKTSPIGQQSNKTTRMKKQFAPRNGKVMFLLSRLNDCSLLVGSPWILPFKVTQKKRSNSIKPKQSLILHLFCSLRVRLKKIILNVCINLYWSLFFEPYQLYMILVYHFCRGYWRMSTLGVPLQLVK